MHLDHGVQNVKDVQDDQGVQDAHPDPVGHGVGARASEVPVDDDNGHQDTEQVDNVIVLFIVVITWHILCISFFLALKLLDLSMQCRTYEI